MSLAPAPRIHVEFAVTPPAETGIAQTLLPPVIARTNAERVLESIDRYYAVLTATDVATGELKELAVGGDVSITGKPLEASDGRASSSQPKWVYFIFTNVIMQIAGEWYLTVSVMDTEDPASQPYHVEIGANTAGPVKVLVQAPRPRHPSKSVSSNRLLGCTANNYLLVGRTERALIQKLRAHGLME